ncbi:MAG: HXXEE domain-containing protein [Pseudomonadota bacterium]
MTSFVMMRRGSLACLVIGFAMLWVPVGQHDFLVENWMKVGTFMAPFLVLMAFAFRSEQANSSGPDVRFVSAMLLLAYIIHQFEEHWVDLYGNTYAFKPYLNDMLLDRLGGHEGSPQALTDAGVFVINTSLVWLVAMLAIWRGSSHLFPTLCMTSIVFVNALSHTGAALLNGSYNPGLLTAIIVFLPLALSVSVSFGRSGVASFREATASVIWAVLAHAIMILGMISTRWLMLLPEAAYFVILIAWSIMPVFIFYRPVGAPSE